MGDLSFGSAQGSASEFGKLPTQELGVLAFVILDPHGPHELQSRSWIIDLP